MSAVLLRSNMAYADPTGGKPVAGEETVGAPNIRVRIEAGRLTLDADNASLADVLTMVGKQADIEIILHGDLGAPVTKSFSEEPLDGAIAHLLRNTSFVMIYGQPQDAGDLPPLVQIRIINSRSANQAAPSAASTSDFDEDQSEAAIAARRAIMLGLDPAPQNGAGLFAGLAGLESNQRLYAMQWLADVGDEEAIRALGRFLALDAEPAIRNEAALALGDIGSEAASQALALGLGDSDPDVRFQVVEAMGGVARQRTTLVLGQVLFGETDPEVRMSAIAGLGRSRSEAAWAFLEAATEDPDPEVRKIANGILATWDLGKGHD